MATYYENKAKVFYGYLADTFGDKYMIARTFVWPRLREAMWHIDIYPDEIEELKRLLPNPQDN